MAKKTDVFGVSKYTVSIDNAGRVFNNFSPFGGLPHYGEPSQDKSKKKRRK